MRSAVRARVRAVLGNIWSDKTRPNHRLSSTTLSHRGNVSRVTATSDRPLQTYNLVNNTFPCRVRNSRRPPRDVPLVDVYTTLMSLSSKKPGKATSDIPHRKIMIARKQVVIGVWT
ncbi:hypothetical protein GW17_00049248 [Ensete ventricosum]|nr:hypothetical protein GW17_00049248 [Ensete ventricosum]